MDQMKKAYIRKHRKELRINLLAATLIWCSIIFTAISHYYIGAIIMFLWFIVWFIFICYSIKNSYKRWLDLEIFKMCYKIIKSDTCPKCCKKCAWKNKYVGELYN